MSIIDKVFKYEETELSIIKCKDETYDRGKTIAEILGYAIQRKEILDHVDHEDKRKLSELVPKFRGSKTKPLTNNQKTQFILTSLGYTA